jgi:diaminopimelate epimerase
MRFTKMQGVGNDFVVLDAAALPENGTPSRLAVALCDRHTGIGADGLLVVQRGAGDAVFSMRMFNPDGTEDMCGNGLRCAGLWAYRAGWVEAGPQFEAATKEGRKSLQIVRVAEDGRTAVLRVAMGAPQFSSSAIPFCGGPGPIIRFPLPVGDQVFPITTLNTGSTHTVIFGGIPPDEQTFQRVSPLIERHPLFPERTSVLWATPQEEGVLGVRIWERGVGETLGCGTGACAVGVAAQVQELSPAGQPVTVVSRGGTLEIAWAGDEAPVIMTGPAEFIFDGECVAAP